MPNPVIVKEYFVRPNYLEITQSGTGGCTGNAVQIYQELSKATCCLKHFPPALREDSVVISNRL